MFLVFNDQTTEENFPSNNESSPDLPFLLDIPLKNSAMYFSF